MLVIPLDDFVHGTINARRGYGLDLDEALARDLERRGLIKIKAYEEVNDTREPVTGKSQAAGADQPSSASPAAPVLPETTANQFDGGRRPGRPRKVV